MIYLVEDDQNLRELVTYTLSSLGMAATGFAVPSAFWAAMQRETPQLVLLDLMLPEEDGLSVLKKLRDSAKWARLPVIILTAKDSEYDRVVGLDRGADDYVTKPFGMMELVARIKAVLRRVDPATEEIYRAGTLELNAVRHTVTAAGQPVTLTRKEYDLLRLLLQNPGMVFTRDQLLDRVWGYAFNGENRTVDVHIRTLRQKLGDAGECVETVRGLGYKLNARG